MGILAITSRGFGRLRTRGLADVVQHGSGVVATTYLDLRYGRKLCKWHFDSNKEREGHNINGPTSYAVLRAIFDRVSISRNDVLVDVGCGDGRVINFWLSRSIKNRIIGIEANPQVARDATVRYSRFPNVKIVEGFAEKVARQLGGTIFYLYSPFSEKILVDFEQTLRGSSARIIYCDFHVLTPFENAAWNIEIVRQTEPFQYQCAYISSANSG